MRELDSDTPRRRRCGFTLVELLVAIVLIDVGVLALVSESAVLVRSRNSLRLRARAAELASDRVASLSAGGCAPNAGSATALDGTVESWSIALAPNQTREVRDSVTFTEGGVARAVVLRTRLPC